MYPILISRRRRDHADDWNGTTSWFGGQPHLGSVAWPRDTDGRALPFGAQLDLGDLAPLLPPGLLPASGSLAVFLDSGAVVYVPPGDLRQATPTPDFHVPAYEPQRDLFPRIASPAARAAFPRWPVHFTKLDLPALASAGDADGDVEASFVAERDAVDAYLPRRPYFFDAAAAYKTLGDGHTPFWWHGVQAYIEQLGIALFHADVPLAVQRNSLFHTKNHRDTIAPAFRWYQVWRWFAAPSPAVEKAAADIARIETRILDIQRQQTQIPAWIKTMRRFAADRDPWTTMTPDAVSAFEALRNEIKAACPDLVRYSTAHSLKDLATETLQTMMTGPAEAFAALPTDVRDLLNDAYRLPTDGWHKMFGRGVCIQTAADEHAEGGDILLLQLVYGDLMDWRFGDIGAYQFWISPDDLAARRWDRVTVTCECH